MKNSGSMVRRSRVGETEIQGKLKKIKMKRFIKNGTNDAEKQCRKEKKGKKKRIVRKSMCILHKNGN